MTENQVNSGWSQFDFGDFQLAFDKKQKDLKSWLWLWLTFLRKKSSQMTFGPRLGTTKDLNNISNNRALVCGDILFSSWNYKVATLPLLIKYKHSLFFDKTKIKKYWQKLLISPKNCLKFSLYIFKASVVKINNSNKNNTNFSNSCRILCSFLFVYKYIGNQ